MQDALLPERLMSSNEQATVPAPEPDGLPGHTAMIVSAYVANNTVASSALPDLIHAVHQALKGLAAPADAAPGDDKKLQPPVPIKKSVTPDYIISLEDGKPYKSLKRHLAGRGLTPQEYRTKWGLPLDYPMVSPNYSKVRAEHARSLGLGRKRKGPDAPAAAEPVPAPKRRAGRKAG